MKRFRIPFMRKFLKEELGQTAVVVALTITAMLALAGTSVEVGHIYYAYHLLVASTNSATLAGAQAMPDITAAQANVTTYSSQAGKENANNFMTVTSLTTKFYCSSTATSLNVGCQTPPSSEGSCTGGGSCNALTVTQTASVPLWFGGLLGMRKMNITAQSSAAMRGGSDTPYNIAVIIDTTGSMGSGTAPASDGCGGDKQIQCAVSGLKQFLLQMDPCPLSTNCSATTAYVDDVALFVFPAVASGNASKDTTCPTTNPATVPYNFTNVTSTSQDLNLWDTMSNGSAVTQKDYQGGYEVVTFNNTYKSNDSDTTLATTNDPLAVAAGGGGCQGLQAPGGQATYYAQVIRQAQAALIAMQGGTKGSQNIMIILSDGDANACNAQAYTPYGGNNCGSGTAPPATAHNDIVADNCPAISSTGGCIASPQDSTNPCPPASGVTCSGSPLNGTYYYKNSTTTYKPTGYNSPTYPSALGQCGQAVEAAQMATAAGTTVYTVAMGSETSGGCTTDAYTTVSDSYTGATYGTAGYSAGQQPCQAIQAMATNQNYSIKSNPTFYSDATSGCKASGSAQDYTTIGGIFQAIANGLTSARLIPVGS
ncbi:MAG: TadE/TadG family type IV pilus assembly protein [Terracidiphilus sp.]